MTTELSKGIEAWKQRVEKKFNINLLIDDGGKKYIRILQRGGSAYCFIECLTGNVLMAATFSRPAKYPRGNIYNVGFEGVTEYGAIYLK